MATQYEHAPKAVQALVELALRKYHPELDAEAVSVDTIIVRRVVDDEDVHALKRAGYGIDAKISATSLADRARGIADAKLMIDGCEWNKATDRQRLALIDHELEHLILVPGLHGIKRDDLGRPLLKCKPHDWELTGFQNVAGRHGEHSHEAMQFAAFRDEHGQLNFFGPSALQVAEGKDGNALAALADSVRKVLKPGKGIDSVTMTVTTPGRESVTVSSDDLKDLSNACAARHHARCSYEKCQCACGHPDREGEKVNG